MRTRLLLALPVTAFVAVACSKDATGPSPTYANIAGTYNGALAGTAQGVALQALFSITLTQSAGNLSGSYGLSGTLNDGVNLVTIQGAGTVTGTIAAGNNPSVNVTIRTALCPNYQAHFSGAYDSVNQKLTISGPVDILNNSCAIVLTYQSTIILSR